MGRRLRPATVVGPLAIAQSPVGPVAIGSTGTFEHRDVRARAYKDVFTAFPGDSIAAGRARDGRRSDEGSRPVSRVLSRAAIPLGYASPRTSSDLPGSSCGHTRRSPIRSCSGWGLPCRSVLPPARCALTAPFHPYLPFPAGGLFSVALSVGSRLPGVTWHPAHGARTFLQGVYPQRLLGRLPGVSVLAPPWSSRR